MSILAATCATLAAMLALAQPGDTVKLEGECDRVVIANQYERRVTLNADKAVIRGLTLKGSNLTVIGGVFVAIGGMDGFAYDGYAIDIRGARDVRVTGALITDAKKGIVVTDGRNIVLDRNRYWRLREDGVIATRTENFEVSYSRFTDFAPRKTQCTFADGTVTWGLAKRDCPATATFKDGNHDDAVQFYNRMVNVRVRDNFITGVGQGIGEFGGAGDVVSRKVTIERNRVAANGGHQITLYDCEGCLIANNIVRRGGAWKAVVRAGQARRCGNEVEGEKPDAPC